MTREVVLCRDARTLPSGANLARAALAASAVLFACAACGGMPSLDLASFNLPSLDLALPMNTAANAETTANIETKSQAPILCDSKDQSKTDDCLPLFKGLATQDGDKLQLNLENGKTKTYTSNRKACDADDGGKCINFKIVGFYPRIQSLLVAVGYYEEAGYELVSRRTGKVLQISSIPQFSPNGKFFISVDQSDLGDRKYDLAIWSAATDPPSLAFKYKAKQYEHWEFVDWQRDDHIRLKAYISSRQGAYDQEAEAVRFEKGWKIVLGKKLDEG